MKCPGCGGEIRPEAKFCDQCGMKIVAMPPQAPQAGAGAAGPPTAGRQPPPGVRQPGGQPPPAEQQLPPVLGGVAVGAAAAQGPPTQQIPKYPQEPAAPGFQPGVPIEQPPGLPRPGAPPRRSSGGVISGIAVMVCGIAIIVSTFLAWVSVGGRVSGTSASAGAGISGWNTFHQGLGFGSGSNWSFIATGDGLLFFTGFFSLIFGLLLLVMGILILSRLKFGAVLGLIFGILSVGIAAVNIVMIYVKLSGTSVSGTVEGYSYSASVGPGIGLWIFAALSLVAVVFCIVSFRYIKRGRSQEFANYQ